MKNNNKTKEQLILEIEKLKNEVAKQKEVKKTYKETDKKTFFIKIALLKF